MTYTFHWVQAFNALPAMLAGAWVTMELAVLSMGIGTVAAILLAVALRSGITPLRLFASGWVGIARNTPSLFQVYMVYFGLGSLGLHLDSFPSLLLGLTFNNAGYLAETFRAGLRAVPEIQVRAGRSLGMGRVMTFRLIVLPQLLRLVFHPMTNQMVWSVLMTSLGVVVGLNNDLTGVTQELNVKTYRTFEFFILAAGLYYGISKTITTTARLLAWRLFRY